MGIKRAQRDLNDSFHSVDFVKVEYQQVYIL